MRRIRALALYALLAAVAAGTASAQTTTATIEGVVTDSSGAVMQGAKVEVEGADGLRTFSTDADGSYRAVGLPPGRYAVTATSAPFQPRRVDGIDVAINRTVILDLKLDVARQSETVDVRAPLATMDPTRSAFSHVIDARALDTIPLNGRNYLDLVLLTPGAISSATRTELADRDTRGAIFGERGGNAAFLIDGFENNDDVRGGVFQGYTQDAIQEFEVIAAGYKAEFGRGSGGVINVITKSGGNTLTGTGAFFFRDDALDASNVDGKEPPELGRYNSSLVFGGPVTRDRAWYFAAIEHLYERRGAIFPVNTPPILSAAEDFSESPTSDTERLFGKYTRRLTGTQDFRVETGWSRVAAANQLPSTTSMPSASIENDTDSALSALGHRYLGSRLIVDSSLSYRDQRYDVNPGLGPGISSQVNFPGVGTFYVGPRYDLTQTLDQRYVSGRSAANLFWNKHNAKAGLEYLHTSVDGRNGQGLTNLVASNNFAAYGLQGYSIPQGHGFINPGDELSAMRNHGVSLFAQDDWRLLPSVTLNLGLRWDYDSRFNDADNIAPRLGVAWSISEATVARASWGLFYDRYRLGLAQAVPELGGFNGKAVVEFDYPRLAADVPPGSAGTLGRLTPLTGDPFAIHKRFGIPADALVSEQNIQALTGLTPSQFLAALTSYLAGYGNFRPVTFSPSTGYLRMDLGALYADQVTVARPFKTPYNNTFTIGLDHRIVSDVTVGASFVGRAIRNVLGIQLTNLAFQSRNVGLALTTDGQPLERSYGPWYDGDYKALVLTIDKPFDGRFQWQGSYTYSVGEDNLLNPNLAFGVNAQGAGAVPTDNLDLEFDRGNSDLLTPHVFVASGSAALPFDLIASAALRATSGTFFSAAGTLKDYDGDGVASSRPVGTQRNEFRGPHSLNVDTRLEKRFKVGGLTASALVEFFNLFNARNPRTVDNNYTASGPVATFGQVNVPYPGRETQIGFRLIF